VNVVDPPLRLNLGSGNRPLPGYVNVDSRELPTVDVVADVRSLPFVEGSAVEIAASSLLEHFRDPYEVLDEIHRVLAPAGVVRFRVPSPWSQAGQLDPEHVFLADLKQWREILGGYFANVSAQGEGVRYRDNKLLAALCHLAVRVLQMHELAQTWLLTCSAKRERPTRAYVPWWLEAKYGE
jgi:ubiquinone/menaquinone biosynthesis C-methylase UbiE